MRFFTRLTIVGLSLAFLLPLMGAPATTTQAQDPASVANEPISGRYQIDVPDGWVSETDQIRGIEGVFIEELIAIADSEDAMNTLQAVDPTAPKQGKTLIANIFPLALAWQGAPTYDSQEVFTNILGPSAETATFLDIDGLPAVVTRDYFGPPYTNAEFAGQTMIMDGDLIYFIIYSGQSEADLAELEGIAATFTTTDFELEQSLTVENLDRKFTVTGGNFSITIGQNWLISKSATGTSESFLIVPEPEKLLPFIFGGQFSDDLPGLFVQVLVQPYDLLYGTTDTLVTEEDRSQILDQAIGSLNAVPTGQPTETIINDVVTLQADIEGAFGGNNVGKVIVFDSGEAMYSLTLIGNSANWDTTYLPLVDPILQSVEINAIPTDSVAGEVPIGTQRGQQAPDFTLKVLDGSSVSLSDYRGQVVLLNFWATWCAPCRVEMPEFQASYVANQDNDFVVLAVNLMETQEQASAYATELGLTFPIALDVDGGVNSLYNVIGYPSSYLIDADGIIRAVNAGPISSAQIQQWIELVQ